MPTHRIATRDPRPSTFKAEGARYDHPRTFAAPPVWDDDAYPGESRWLRFADRHPIVIDVLASLAIIALQVLFLYVAVRS